jgi:hypothetical protein
MFSKITVDEGRARVIAREYMASPLRDESALNAFEAFRTETARQYSELARSVRVSVVESDPYADYPAMAADASTGRLSVLSSDVTGGHCYLTPAENDMFRAVHDYYGHYGTGRDFSRHGEEAAWRKHSLMYSPLARRAMTTETRGQNSAFIFELGGRDFPVQKLALLPEWVVFNA